MDFPALKGPEVNTVLIQMIRQYAPGILAGFLGAGVFAAIMSSLDSQSLSLGSMFTNDIVRPYLRKGGKEQMTEKQQVWVGRLFVIAIISITYILSLIAKPSIFRLAIWSSQVFFRL